MPEKKKKGTKKTGIAAKAGMRPSVKSPQQWAMARVNSFIARKPGTWGKADADLAARARAAKKKKK